MKETSWGKVADWYDELVSAGGNYQTDVILPGLLRLLGDIKGKQGLDLACGQGFFTESLFKAGAKMTGCDISKELIALAKKRNPAVRYEVSPAEKLPFGQNAFDFATCVLAIQNIKGADKAIEELARVLRPGGRAVVVLNHPAFRIPKLSSWVFDEEKEFQYRRLDAYMSESKSEIEMHPGQKRSERTVSFHRPLQYYFKIFDKCGLATLRLEEWISNKQSEKGPRKAAEDRARKEFPLFMAISLEKK